MACASYRSHYSVWRGDCSYIWLANSKQISRTRPGFTLGFRFFAWPTRSPAAWSLPALTSATILGLAATSSRQRRSVPIHRRRDAHRRDHFAADLPGGEHLGEHFAAAAGVEVAGWTRRNQLGQAGGGERELLDRDRRSLSVRSTSCCIQLLASLPSPTSRPIRRSNRPAGGPGSPSRRCRRA